MKKLILLIAFLLFYCKNKQPTYSYKYKQETTKLLNESFLKFLHSEYLKNNTIIQVSEIPERITQSSDIRNFIIKTHHHFTQNEIDSSKKYAIQNWKNINLSKTKIIDTITQNYLYSIFDIYSEEQAKHLGISNTITDSLYNNYTKSWKDIIGDSYLNISSPIFNSEFSAAYLISNVSDGDGCFFGRKFYEFTKINGEWMLDKYDYFD